MPLISDEYREVNRELHEKKSTYGTSGHLWAGHVIAISNLVGSTDVLDYGCGKSTLAKSLGFSIAEYDPAVLDKAALPEAHDIVVCTDVLEHIEPDNLHAVLNHLSNLTNKVALLVAATRPAKKNLPDGRNAHLIVENEKWWLQHISHYFDTIPLCSPEGKDELVMMAVPRKDYDHK